MTHDDIIDVLREEATEDIQKIGRHRSSRRAVSADPVDADDQRAGWLAALFIGEMLTATAMGYYEDQISRAVVLALFVPLIISSGGNSGSQATTLVIRAMALKEIRISDWWRVLRRVQRRHRSRLYPRDNRSDPYLGMARSFSFLRRSLHADRADRRRPVGNASGFCSADCSASTRFRPGERVGAFRCHAGRCHQIDHLLHSRDHDLTGSLL